jgi:DNA-binding NarL/FixJ family response regulator
MVTQKVGVNDQGRRVGESHYRAVLSDHEVGQVLMLRTEGWTYRAIALTMEVSKGTVRDIVKGRRRAQFPVRFKAVCVID